MHTFNLSRPFKTCLYKFLDLGSIFREDEEIKESPRIECAYCLPSGPRGFPSLCINSDICVSFIPKWSIPVCIDLPMTIIVRALRRELSRKGIQNAQS